jgi:hypothetical protein
VTVRNFTGDGLYIATADGYVANLQSADFESGSLDSSGKPIPDATKIRIKNQMLTSFTHPIFQTRRFMQLSYPKGIDKKSLYDIYFYSTSGSLISSTKSVQFSWQDVPIPDGAAYFNAVFNYPTTTDAFVRFDAKLRATHVTVKNSDISLSRRQGITVGGADDVLITNNQIHHIKGTAPQSGIDLEGAYFLNSNIKITQNNFYNNQSYDVILFDGRDATVDGNVLGSTGAIGITNTELFTGARVLNNTLQGSFMLLNQDVYAENNTVIDGWAKFVGPRATVNGMQLTDSSLEIAASTPNGVTVTGVTMTNNQKIDQALVVNGSPVVLNDITINGPTKLRSLVGDVAAGTVFNRLKITNYNGDYGIDLPVGTYNQCVIEGSTGGDLPTIVNKPGSFVFNQCTFRGKSGLRITNANADVTVKDSTFDMQSNLAWEKAAIMVQAAKNVALTNNKFQAMHLDGTNVAIIKINNAGAALVKGNSIQTNLIPPNSKVIGISTTGAGTGAPPYVVEDNTLTNAVLDLRASDVNNRNIVQ